jgi:hypothetical protein
LAGGGVLEEQTVLGSNALLCSILNDGGCTHSLCCASGGAGDGAGGGAGGGGAGGAGVVWEHTGNKSRIVSLVGCFFNFCLLLLYSKRLFVMVLIPLFPTKKEGGGKHGRVVQGYTSTTMIQHGLQ